MNASPLQIRLATDADRAQLVPMINSAFTVEGFIEGTRTDDERLAAMMQKGDILVLEDAAGNLLGCIYTEVRGARGYLGMLAVDPASQGAGLGRRLVGAAEDHLRHHGCEAVEINVLSLRPELMPIYRRLGFVENGTAKFYPSRPLKAGIDCHCIIMSKQI
ncbi:MAG: GNAT family N-acetyltransferase [Terracidiphilus sp.]|jgi:ribosomal protein S18 acetylase RimI-like enzyme